MTHNTAVYNPTKGIKSIVLSQLKHIWTGIKVEIINHAEESNVWAKDSNFEEYLNHADNMAFSMISNKSDDPFNQKSQSSC